MGGCRRLNFQQKNWLISFSIALREKWRVCDSLNISSLVLLDPPILQCVGEFVVDPHFRHLWFGGADIGVRTEQNVLQWRLLLEDLLDGLPSALSSMTAGSSGGLSGRLRHLPAEERDRVFDNN